MPGLGDLIGSLQKAQQGGSGGGIEDVLGGMLGGGSRGGGGGGLGDLLGGALGGGRSSAAAGTGQAGGLVGMLGPLLASLLASGGLQSILGGMRAQGLSAQADSWVGTGENLPIDADQVRGAVGADRIGQIAEQLGIDGDQAAGLLAKVLPGLVNSVTPDGEEPESGELEGLAGMLKGLR